MVASAVASMPRAVRGTVTATGTLGTILSAMIRAIAAVVSALVLATGVALVLWAITPSAGADAAGALGASVVVFASAHFLPVTVGGVAVTIHPLLLTGVAVALIATAVGRARMVRGRTLEALHACVFAVTYAASVAVAVALAAPDDVAGVSFLAPLAIAALGAVLSLGLHDTAWHQWWRDRAPTWAQGGVRAGLVVVMTMLTAGAVILAAALVTSFPDVIGVAELTVHSAGAGLGMALLCLALLPNAVIAAVGYSTGAGFGIGAASFSPLTVHAAQLPAIPLLAAAPKADATIGAWITLAAPVIAALIAALLISRSIDTRYGRLVAGGIAAVVAGLAIAGLAAVAGGGVAAGPWAASGVSPLVAGGLIAGVTIVMTGALAVSTAAPGGWGSIGPTAALRRSRRRIRYDDGAGQQSVPGNDGVGGGEDAADVEDGEGDETNLGNNEEPSEDGDEPSDAVGDDGADTADADTEDDGHAEDDAHTEDDAHAENDADNHAAGGPVNDDHGASTESEAGEASEASDAGDDRADAG